MTSILHFFDKWTLKEQVHFLLNLGNCLEKGFPLYEAMQLQQAEARIVTRSKINQMITQLESGLPMAHVFRENGFSQEVATVLHFTAKTGSLSKGLIESGNLLRVQAERKEKIYQLIRYPLFLFFVLMVMGYIIIRHLLPSFNILYHSMSLSLPPVSRIILASSTLLPPILIGLGVGAPLITISLLFLKKRLPIEKRLLVLVSLPGLSYIFRLGLTSSFASNFGSLINIGMPVNQALKFMSEQSYNPFLKTEAKQISNQLNEGINLAEVLSVRPFYTKDLPTVVRNAAESGRLGLTLVDYSQLLFKTLETHTYRYLMMIQPLCFFLFGGFILIMFLSILLPMFDIMKGL